MPAAAAGEAARATRQPHVSDVDSGAVSNSNSESADARAIANAVAQEAEDMADTQTQQQPSQQQQQQPVQQQHIPALAFAPCPATEPVRRVVSILQTQIAALEKQAKMKAKPSKDQNQQTIAKCDDVLPLLEFAWDLIKQVMGIAVLSENETKKQAKKDSALRKSQDLQLVHQVILVLACLEQINADRLSFLSGNGETNSISEEDVEAVDKIYPELSRKPSAEEGAPSFQDRTMNAAKHILAIIEGDLSEVHGTTYAHLKDVVTNVHESGYFDHPREAIVEDMERLDVTVREDTNENTEHMIPPHSAPIVPVNPPPPAPQAVPTPAFSILPPRAPPVTLQQVEHAYFAQQYGHQHQPVPEVFGPQSFIFIQDSELDSADISQQPTPRPASPAAIPSQTFTNQSFTIPQHFTPEIPQNPHLPINEMAQPVHYPSNVNEVQNAIANFSTANPPPPIPMPPNAHPNMPPHMSMPSGQVVNHPHPIQQRLPSPSFQQPLPFKPQATHATEPMANQTANEINPDENTSNTTIEQESPSREWIENTQIENQSEQLEIDEWNPETVPESSQTNGQASDKFRPRGRGRGSGNFRGRGGYQNGRSGSYFRNNDNGQSNNTVNGGNYDNNFRENRNDGNRFENYQGNFRGRGSNGRGSARQNGGTRPPRNAQSRGTGGARSQYVRKPAPSNNHFDARNGIDSNNKQQTYAH